MVYVLIYGKSFIRSFQSFSIIHALGTKIEDQAFKISESDSKSLVQNEGTRAYAGFKLPVPRLGK